MSVNHLLIYSLKSINNFNIYKHDKSNSESLIKSFTQSKAGGPNKPIDLACAFININDDNIKLTVPPQGRRLHLEINDT